MSFEKGDIVALTHVLLGSIYVKIVTKLALEDGWIVSELNLQSTFYGKQYMVYTSELSELTADEAEDYVMAKLEGRKDMIIRRK